MTKSKWTGQDTADAPASYDNGLLAVCRPGAFDSVTNRIDHFRQNGLYRSIIRTPPLRLIHITGVGHFPREFPLAITT